MSYDINSIESLSFKDGVRKRIQMYLGSDDIEGTYQAFKEIINNSTDEALAGFGKKIDICVNEIENSVSVRDYARGVPFGVREDGENVLVSIYSKSHTGGKFSDGAYKNASGLNGIGAKCVCLSSKYFKVHSFRDGIRAEAIFSKGDLVSYIEDKTSEPNGTYVYFIPDEEVFSNGEIGYTYSRLCDDIHDISYLYSGIEFNINGILADGTTKNSTYCAKNGIIDFVKDNNKSPLHSHVISSSASNGEDSVEIAFQWGTKRETGYVFVNGLRCPECGTPITGAKTAITRTINSLAGKDFDGDKIRDNLFYVINCNVAHPSFANQTKSKINNASLRTLASNAFTNALKEMKSQFSSEFKAVVDLLTKVDKAEKAAEKTRDAILNHEREQVAASKKKLINSDKLRDAKKLGEDSILLVCEGLSAGGSMSIGRDINKYGILMLRGKAINCLSNPIEDILENEEVKLLLQALGITYGKPYNAKKLRYGKIAIASDADFDGSHIGLLIMAMLQRLCPEFIQEGRLNWLVPPLYKLEKSKKVWYYYSEDEFQNRKEGNGEIIKYKGLGQMSDSDLKNSMFSSEWQRLEQLIPEEDSIDVLEALMGKNVEPRKKFVFNNIDFGEFVYG